MIEGLKPYAESAKTKPMTRTSEINIPWLTAIPEHWKVVRSKGLFTARTERARPDDEQLSATQAYGVIPQKEFENRVGRKVVRITQNLEKRAHVEPDDFVISMRSFQGGLERAWARGCIRSSYVVLKPSPETDVGYFAHLFKSLDYVRALQATSNFIRDGQDLNFNNFSLVDLPLPPLDEQAVIAKCLDHANRKIDGFIRAKRKLIGLLNEQKQAIIHRAVTCGLDPDAPLKPSGIPWLGDIPMHWEARKLGSLFLRQGSGTTPSGDAYYGGGVPWAMSGDLKDGLIFATKRTVTESALKDFSALKLHPQGSLLVAMYGATIGKSGVLTVAACSNQACCALSSPRSSVNPVFIQAIVNVARPHLMKQAYGGGQPNINAEVVRSLRVPLPPLAEQDSILGYLDGATNPIVAAIARTEREIALMQEYRTRLTADIVTGKLDVREAAVRLPDLPIDPVAAPLDDEAMEEIEDESLN